MFVLTRVRTSNATLDTRERGGSGGSPLLTGMITACRVYCARLSLRSKRPPTSDGVCGSQCFRRDQSTKGRLHEDDRRRSWQIVPTHVDTSISAWLQQDSGLLDSSVQLLLPPSPNFANVGQKKKKSPPSSRLEHPNPIN